MKWPALLLLALAGLCPAADPPPDMAVVVIRTPTGGGSGFLAKLDGKTYIVTNQHILMGTQAADVHITFPDGTPAHPTAPEIVGDLDLARLLIDTKRVPLQCAAGQPRNGDEVTAIGNSLDAGVLTTGRGTILGVGATEIETDCDFVPGNSGGPIVDASNNVLALATYIRMGEKNATTQGTRYAKGRRFAVRVQNGMKWIPVAPWEPYAKAGAMIEDARHLCAEVVMSASAMSGRANFKPKNANVAAAIADFERLQTRMAKLAAQTATVQDLQRNNSILAATYRVAMQKLRDACLQSQKSLDRKIPAQWGWLEKERQTTFDHLKDLSDSLDEASRQKPEFLSY